MTADDLDEAECPDIWHLLGDVTADECPTCGYRMGGDDTDAPWPDDVIIPKPGEVTGESGRATATSPSSRLVNERLRGAW